MSFFFAEFCQCGVPPCFIRKDTRVYYHAQTLPPATLRPLGKCVGIVWMCNPGSAGSPPQQSPWASISGDPTLWRIHRLYKKVVHTAGKQGAVKPHDYISILNCFYSVGPDPDFAYDEWRRSSCSHHESICPNANFALLAWGLNTPYGPARRAIEEIETWGRYSSGQPIPGRLIVYIDPSVPNGSQSVNNDLDTIYYPSHPNSRAFESNIDLLAAALANFILSDVESEDVTDLDE